MTSYTIGQAFPPLSLNTDSVAVMLANVASLDFFPGLIDPDYARGVGHRTVFMNTMTQLSIMDRYALEALAHGRIRSHELVMRKPTYGGMELEVVGQVSATMPFAGSKLAGPGTEVVIDVEIRAEGEVRTKGKVSVIVP